MYVSVGKGVGGSNQNRTPAAAIFTAILLPGSHDWRRIYGDVLAGAPSSVGFSDALGRQADECPLGQP